MRSSLPPVEIDGFHHPHALTGIAERHRPAWGSSRCGTCSGRGARNEILHVDSMRCRIAACGECDGAGWLTSDGTRHLPDIVLVGGMPAWTTAVVPPAPIRRLPACIAPDVVMDGVVPETSWHMSETGGELSLAA